MNPQNVSNILWAFATMGKKVGNELMRLLDVRVEEIAVAREFTAQVNTATLVA